MLVEKLKTKNSTTTVYLDYFKGSSQRSNATQKGTCVEFSDTPKALAF